MPGIHRSNPEVRTESGIFLIRFHAYPYNRNVMPTSKFLLLAACWLAVDAFAQASESPFVSAEPADWYPTSGAAAKAYAEASLHPAPPGNDLEDWYAGKAMDADAMLRTREKVADAYPDVSEWVAGPRGQARNSRPLPRTRVEFPGRGSKDYAEYGELGSWYGAPSPAAVKTAVVDPSAWDAWGEAAPPHAVGTEGPDWFSGRQPSQGRSPRRGKPLQTAKANPRIGPDTGLNLNNLVDEWMGRAPVRKRKAARTERPDLAAWFDGTAAIAALRLERRQAAARKSAEGHVTGEELAAWFPKAAKIDAHAIPSDKAENAHSHDSHSEDAPHGGQEAHSAVDSHSDGKSHDAEAAHGAPAGHSSHAKADDHGDSHAEHSGNSTSHDSHADTQDHGSHADADAHDAHGSEGSHGPGDHGEGEKPYMAPRPDTAFARAVDWEQGAAEVLEYAVKRSGGTGESIFRGRLTTERIFLKPDGTVGRKSAGKQDMDALSATLALFGEEDGMPFMMETVAKLPRREAFRLLRQDQSLQGSPGNAHRSLDCLATPPRLRMASSGGEAARDTVLTRWPVYTEEMLFTYLRAVPQRAGYREEVWIQDWGPIGRLMLRPQYADITVRSKVRIRDLETWHVTVDRNDGRRSEFWVSSQGLHPVTLATLVDKSEWSLRNISRRKAPSW